MSRIAIVGTGAIGSCFAAELLRTNSHEVLLLSRHARSGLVVTTPDGTTIFPVSTATDVSHRRVQDWVVVAVKTNQTEDAARHLSALVGPSTRVLVLQNGVEARERLRAYLNDDAIIECVVKCAAERLADGTIRRRGQAHLVVALNTAGLELVDLFQGSAVEVTMTDDLVTAKWRKLCINVSGGSITALTQQPMGVLRQPVGRMLAVALIAECAAVGRALGANLDEREQSSILNELLLQPKFATTSMMRARFGQEVLEHDAISGAVLRGAQRLGIEVPITMVVHSLLEIVSGPAIS